MAEPIWFLLLHWDRNVIRYAQEEMRQHFPDVFPTLMDRLEDDGRGGYGHLAHFDIVVFGYNVHEEDAVIDIVGAIQKRAEVKKSLRAPIILVSFFSDEDRKKAEALASLVNGVAVREARLPMDYLRVIRQKVDGLKSQLAGWTRS